MPQNQRTPSPGRRLHQSHMLGRHTAHNHARSTATTTNNHPTCTLPCSCVLRRTRPAQRVNLEDFYNTRAPRSRSRHARSLEQLKTVAWRGGSPWLCADVSKTIALTNRTARAGWSWFGIALAVLLDETEGWWVPRHDAKMLFSHASTTTLSRHARVPLAVDNTTVLEAGLATLPAVCAALNESTTTTHRCSEGRR